MIFNGSIGIINLYSFLSCVKQKDMIPYPSFILEILRPIQIDLFCNYNI